MKRYNVGVDIDGVVLDFLTQARQWFYYTYGIPDPARVQTAWDFDNLGLSREQINEFWYHVDHEYNWWASLKPLETTTALPELCRNHRVVFITNRKDGRRSSPIELQSADSLTKYFGLKNPTVVISDNKGPVAAGLNLDYFIDDRPINVKSVLDHSPKTRAYLLQASYNVADHGHYKTLESFDEFARGIIRRAHGQGD